MISAYELRKITQNNIEETMSLMKHTVIRPLEDDIERVATANAMLNLPYVRHQFTLREEVPAFVYNHFVNEYLPNMLHDAGFAVESIELELNNFGEYRLLTLNFNWA